MGLLDKLKNIFFEEEVVEEELDNTSTIARKVEIPKKSVDVPVKENKEEVIKIKDNAIKQEKIIDNKEEKKIENNPSNNKFSMMFEEEDFVFDNPNWEEKETAKPKNLYPERKEESYKESLKKEANYAYSKTYSESKETKTFIPSPIISPIYGILDKNYKKEEVVTKKEIRITSSYGKLDLDSVRNKAFGEKESNIPSKEQEKDEGDKLYDVNHNRPSVKGVTLEDADEYYNDLGLAYNVDYSDKARELSSNADIEKNISNNTKKKKKDDDNLFDLIDSMYEKEE